MAAEPEDHYASSVATSVLEAGLALAYQKHGVHLNPDHTAEMFITARTRFGIFKAKAKDAPEESCTFDQACEWVLEQEVPEVDSFAQKLHAAYMTAFHTMIGMQSKRHGRKRSTPRKRTPTERIKDFVTCDPGERQYRFNLPPLKRKRR